MFQIIFNLDILDYIGFASYFYNYKPAQNFEKSLSSNISVS